jgi:hypothetical protein
MGGEERGEERGDVRGLSEEWRKIEAICAR